MKKVDFMSFDRNALIRRFKSWCYNCLDRARELQHTPENKVVSNQIIRSATSSYMNYKAACRAKSNADMIYKLKIVEEETDETCGWLEVMSDRNKEADTRMERKERDELLRIIVASIKTLRNNKKDK